MVEAVLPLRPVDERVVPAMVLHVACDTITVGLAAVQAGATIAHGRDLAVAFEAAVAHVTITEPVATPASAQPLQMGMGSTQIPR